MKITKEQSRKLLEKYHRTEQSKSFLAFRRTVEPTFGCDDAIAVKWCGMWLCIETDGYCHT